MAVRDQGLWIDSGGGVGTDGGFVVEDGHIVAWVLVCMHAISDGYSSSLRLTERMVILEQRE